MSVTLDALQSKSGNEVNLSLLKLGPITQVTIGIIITVMVLLATGITVAVVVTRTQYVAPVAVDDHVEVYKNGIIEIYVLNNDHDSRNDELKIVSVEKPEFGSAKIVKNYVLYHAPPRFAGKISFGYTMTNSKISASAKINVLIKNHPPEPVNFTFPEIKKNSKNNIFNLFYDEVKKETRKDHNNLPIIDIDEGDILKIIGIKPHPEISAHGDVTFDSENIFYTPTKEYNGIGKIIYQISDDNDTREAFLTFQIVNNPPVANPDTYILPINTEGEFNVLENDYDPNGDELTIIDTSYTSNYASKPEVLSNNKISYKPQLNLKSGLTDSFEYIISDGSETATTWVVVKLINIPPTAGNFFVEIPKNSPGELIDLQYADENPGQTLSVTIKQPPQKGIWELLTNCVKSTFKKSLNNGKGETIGEGDGDEYDYLKCDYKLNYIPEKDDLTTQTIIYEVSDGIDKTTGTVTLKIINTAPIAVPDYADCKKNTDSGNNFVDIYILENDYDPNGDEIKLVKTQSPTDKQGTTAYGSGRKYIRYTAPKNGFIGQDSFEYEIEDIQVSDPSKVLRATGKVYITITNTAPQANDDIFTIPFGLTKNLNILENDKDENGDYISIHTLTKTQSNVPLEIVKINNIDHVKYTTLNSGPTTDSFKYKITDGEDISNEATVTINSINIPPKCNDDQVTTLWNSTTKYRFVEIDVLSNDEDENPPDQDKLTVSSITQEPLNGITEIINNKNIKYTPNIGFVGVDTFKYKAKDYLSESSNEGVVTITVINNAPIAVDDSYTNHKWGVTKVYNVMENDYDPDNDEIYLKGISVSPDSEIAELKIVDGNKIEFKAKKVLGDIKFKYKIEDYNKESEAEVTVNVYNNPPIAVDDSLTIHWNSGEQIIYVLDNDIKFEDPIEIKSISPPTGFKGTIIVSEDKKTLKFTPDLSEPIFLGTQTVPYTITDQQADSTANVVITLTNNNKPVAIPKTFSIHWRTTTSRVDVLTASKDNDNDDLTLSIIQNPNNGGTATIKTDTVQYIEYKQKDNRLITEEFTYRISDKAEKSDAKVEFTIYNHPPEAEDIYENIPYNVDPEKMVKVVDVLLKATDDDPQDLNFLDIKSFGDPNNGVVSIVTEDGKKKLKYDPNPQFKGEDSFEYTVTDGLDDVTKTITIKILSAPIQDQIKSYRIHWTNQTAGSTFPVMLGLIDPIRKRPYQITSTVKYPLHALDYHIVEEFDDGEKIYEKIFYKQQTNYIGTDEIHVNYTNEESFQTVFIYIEIYNNRPIAISKSVSTHWKNEKNINLMEGSSDPDGVLDTLVFKEKTNPTTGTLTVLNGIATYTPFNPPTKSLDSFKFKITDGHLDSLEQQVSITITNTPPSANDKSAPVHWRVEKHTQGDLINLLEGASDPNGDSISIKTVSNPQFGTIVKEGGLIYYKPNTGVHTATDIFSYVVTDGYQDTIKTITVTVFNNKPTGVQDNYEFSYDQFPQVLDVLLNDNDIDPEDKPLLIIKSVTTPQHGQATIVQNGKKIQYEPLSTFQGEDTFKYIVTDGIQDSDEITVNVKVIANPAPSATDKTDTIVWKNEKKTYDLKLTDFGGANGIDFTCDITSPQLYGIFSNINKNLCILEYTPKAIINYNLIGVDGRKEAKEVITFTVKDRFNRQVTKTLTITIYNNPPIGRADSYIFAKVSTYPDRILNVLSNDEDFDNDNLIILSNLEKTVGQVEVIEGGKKIKFVEPEGWTGSELLATVKYKITDGQLESDFITVSIKITNVAPTCQNVVKQVTKGTTVQWNLIIDGQCSDENGDTVTLSRVVSSDNTLGTPSKYNPTTAQYVQSSSKSGTHIFEYYVTDGSLESNPCTVTVTINNRPPIASNVFKTFNKQDNANHLIAFSGTDPDPQDTLTLLSLDFSQTGNCLNDVNNGGKVTIENNKLKYVPRNGFYGTCTVDYIIKDSDNNYLTSKARLNVTVVNRLPIAANLEFTTQQGQEKTINIQTEIMNQCSDPDGESVEFVQLDYTKCEAGDPGYCRPAYKPVVQGTQIKWPSDPTWCKTEKVDYIIQTVGDPTSRATGTLSLRYTNCLCRTPADIVFIVDSSGSIIKADWNKVVQFLKDLVPSTNPKFIIGPNDVNIGLLQYASWAKTELNISSSQSTIFTSVSGLSNKQLAGNTGTLFGLQLGVWMVQKHVASKPARKELPKVLVVITDGVSNRPYKCSGTSYYIETKTPWPAWGGDSCRIFYKDFFNKLNDPKWPKATSDTDAENKCKTPLYPDNSCSNCGSKPNACADPVHYTNQINSWRKGVNADADWKVIAIGVGAGLDSNNYLGWKRVQQMSFDPNRAFKVGFDSLDTIVSAIVDSACDV